MHGKMAWGRDIGHGNGTGDKRLVKGMGLWDKRMGQGHGTREGQGHLARAYCKGPGQDVRGHSIVLFPLVGRGVEDMCKTLNKHLLKICFKKSLRHLSLQMSVGRIIFN